MNQNNFSYLKNHVITEEKWQTQGVNWTNSNVSTSLKNCCEQKKLMHNTCKSQKAKKLGFLWCIVSFLDFYFGYSYLHLNYCMIYK